METSINLSKSATNTIFQLLKFVDKTNSKEVLYNKTSREFKRTYGIELENAPLIFVKHNQMWKLNHHTYKSKGRTYESASYVPVVGVKGRFQMLERDIKTPFDTNN